MGLLLIRRGHPEIRQGPDGRPAGDVEQGLLIGAVVKEKTLVVEAGDKVPAQHGQNPVSRLNLSAQHAAQVRKADKTLQQMDLAVQMLDGFRDRIERFVGAVPKEAGAVPEQLGYQPEQVRLLFRQAGQKAPPQQQGGLRGQGADLSQDPPRVARVRRHSPGIEQSKHSVLAGTESGGDFFIGVAVENAGKEAGKTPVVMIDDFHIQPSYSKILATTYLYRLESPAVIPLGLVGFQTRQRAEILFDTFS